MPTHIYAHTHTYMLKPYLCLYLYAHLSSVWGINYTIHIYVSVYVRALMCVCVWKKRKINENFSSPHFRFYNNICRPSNIHIIRAQRSAAALSTQQHMLTISYIHIYVYIYCSHRPCAPQHLYIQIFEAIRSNGARLHM